MEMNEEEEEELGFSRNYFLSKELSGSSKKKSAHKLSDVDLVDEHELRSSLANIEPKHDKEIASLVKSYSTLYPNWLLNLRCGFGLLMYGFGSKKDLIEDFASTSLTDYSVVVINGYLQSINIKQFLTATAELLWDQLKTKPKARNTFTTIDDVFSFLDGSEDDEENDYVVCIVIHNIDGPALREAETQLYLARLASCSHIRIVASIDHVNAPLLWDKKMVHTQFNWYWYHVPTFAPYKVEGIFFPLILAHGNATQSAKTASIVLLSLTPNAQSVFKLLAQHQLEHPDDEGMPIENLYAISREQFLVSSMVTLNSHLTEFKDHELVKTRRHSDGQDCLYIPLKNEALEKVLSEISQ
ncbi:hypothetical protein ACFE04_002699 [Oxalis oulophora]